MIVKQKDTNLLILDFSGTLSLTAARFSQAETLIQALKESGLWQLGLNRLDLFWHEIIKPTWSEGSTTGIGYQAIIATKIKQFWVKQPPAQVARSVTKFADSYFSHSTIDSAWQPLIHRAVKRPDTQVVIATDHYAEATGHIIKQLSHLDIHALSALEGQGRPNINAVLVANSADFGRHKATASFWAILKEALGQKRVAKIVLVDDFGFNEAAQDGYTTPEAIKARLRRTTEALATTFDCPVRVSPFFLETGINPVAAATTHEDHEFQKLITAAEMFINSKLERSLKSPL